MSTGFKSLCAQAIDAYQNAGDRRDIARVQKLAIENKQAMRYHAAIARPEVRHPFARGLLLQGGAIGHGGGTMWPLKTVM